MEWCGYLARNGDTAVADLAPEVAHKTGFQVDAMLLASSFFKPYIKPKYEKGIKAHGHVHRHAQAAWDVEIAKYLKGKQNPDTGNVFTDDEAVEFGKTVNAFADGTQDPRQRTSGRTGDDRSRVDAPVLGR